MCMLCLTHFTKLKIKIFCFTCFPGSFLDGKIFGTFARRMNFGLVFHYLTSKYEDHMSYAGIILTYYKLLSCTKLINS